MSAWFLHQGAVVQAVIAGGFTWLITAAGASLVLLVNRVNRRLLDAMLGFAGGVMIAASFWSLLAPAIEIAASNGQPAWLAALVGFLLGGGSIWIVDKILPHLHPGLALREAEGVHTRWRRSVLLVAAITMHNIPEGLAVGVAFGGAALGAPEATVGGAIALAIGIGLRNFPEGVAVAMPLRGAGLSRRRCLWWGQLSALVEPAAAAVGAAATLAAGPILPYALAFAAGAMVFVVIEEVNPESHQAGNVDWASLWFMIGFSTMMTLDVALG